MKSGKNLVELAQEITRQAEAKKDYIAPTSAVNVTLDESTENAPKLNLADAGSFTIGEQTHRQMGEYLGIPAGFYDRIKEAGPNLRTSRGPALYVETVNSLLRTKAGEAHGQDARRQRPRVALGPLPALRP